MSLSVFVSPPSMAWNSTKTMRFNTKIQKYGGGRRKSLSRWSYPEYNITAGYTCLDQDEIDYCYGFFAKMRGQFSPFLWKDPEDHKQTNVRIGTGDGETKTFQLVRSLAGLFVEPVLDIVPDTLLVYADGTPVNATTIDDGLITLANAPTLGVPITATFEYYWRVAFDEDEMSWENFWYSYYRLKQIRLVTVK